MCVSSCPAPWSKRGQRVQGELQGEGAGSRVRMDSLFLHRRQNFVADTEAGKSPKTAAVLSKLDRYIRNRTGGICE